MMPETTRDALVLNDAVRSRECVRGAQGRGERSESRSTL